MITIKVRNKIATVDGNEMVVNNNNNYILKFDFDSEWDAYPAKTARFVYATDCKKKYIDVPFGSNNECVFPIIKDATYLYVGVYTGNLRTSTPASLTVLKSILDGSPVHEDPPEDVYNQILELIREGAIVGPTGAAIVSTEYIGKDQHGGNIYKQTFDNGSIAYFVAPKGEDGVGGLTDIVVNGENVPTSEQVAYLPDYPTRESLGVDQLDQDLQSEIDRSTRVEEDISEEIDDINGKIPNNASTQNKLTTSDDLASAVAGVVTNFVVDAEVNPIFDSDEKTITISGSFVDLNGNTITVDKLKPGANIYVTDLDIYDRWVGIINLDVTPNTATLYKLTSEKVPVADVQTPDGASLVSGGVAKIPLVGLLLANGAILPIDTHGYAQLPDAPVKGALLAGVGATIDADGNIVVPIGSSTNFGLFKTNAGAGINHDHGALIIEPATSENIANRTTRRPVTPQNSNETVIAVLTDANHIILTDAQKAVTKQVFGIPDPAQTTIWSEDEV